MSDALPICAGVSYCKNRARYRIVPLEWTGDPRPEADVCGTHRKCIEQNNASIRRRVEQRVRVAAGEKLAQRFAEAVHRESGLTVTPAAECRGGGIALSPADAEQLIEWLS